MKEGLKTPRMPTESRPPRGAVPRDYPDRSNPPPHNYTTNSWKDSSRASISSGSLPPRMPRSLPRGMVDLSNKY